MEILFLGTGASEGWPGLFCPCEHCLRAVQAGGKNVRTRTSFLVDGSLLIDPFEGLAKWILGVLPAHVASHFSYS